MAQRNKNYAQGSLALTEQQSNSEPFVHRESLHQEDAHADLSDQEDAHAALAHGHKTCTML